MTTRDIEAIYEAIAKEIDAAGEDKAELFLAKLALLLARETGDRDRVMKCVTAAGSSL